MRRTHLESVSSLVILFYIQFDDLSRPRALDECGVKNRKIVEKPSQNF